MREVANACSGKIEREMAELTFLPKTGFKFTKPQLDEIFPLTISAFYRFSSFKL